MNTAAVPGTQTATRAVRILKLFLTCQHSLTLAQIADRLGLNRTTAFRLLSALEAEGMIERDDSGAYHLGPTTLELGRRAAGQPRQLATVAAEVLDALATATGETVSLEALADTDVVVVADAQVDRILAAVSYVGERWPAHTTATGKVLLAALSREDCRGLLPARLRSLTAHTITGKREFEAELARARSDGYALNLEELEIGFVAIAVPVDDGRGGLMSALSIGGPKSRLARRQLKQWLPMLRDAARDLSARWTGGAA